MAKVAAVAGVGPGNGAAIVRRFAAAGYKVAMLARNRDRLDDLARVAAAVATIRAELGEVEALIFNAGSGVFADVEHITPAEFEASWRVNAYGALLCAQQVIPAMKAAG